jgi:hypothetical protein
MAGVFVLFHEMMPSMAQVEEWTEQKLQIAAAPILDALEICGYGKLLSEFYGDNQLWKAVSDVWDGFLKESPNALGLLAVILTAGVPSFQIPLRGIIRTQWSMRVQQKLRELPRRHSYRAGISAIVGFDTIDHPSPLVRYCARYDFQNGRDIFAALYLAKLPGADKLDWGASVRDLDESLEREEGRRDGGNAENDAER